MAFDYEEAKAFFLNKLTHDLEGRGRIESAFYHTARLIYQRGYEDVAADSCTSKYREVLKALDMEEGDPVPVIQMWQSWEAEAQVRAETLEQHLRAVLEVARTWQPDYATKADIDTLRHAAVSAGLHR